MKADVDAVIETFGKNDQVKKVFWTMFVSMAGLVLARVLDPVTAQQVVGRLPGWEDKTPSHHYIVYRILAPDDPARKSEPIFSPICQNKS